MKPGDIITVENRPFLREKVELPPDDPEGTSFVEIESWRPGIRTDDWGQEYAHGVGAMLLTIVSLHKLPRPYQERVFYTRRWRDPDGKVFGRDALRIMARSGFTHMTRGYRVRFELQEYTPEPQQ